MYEPIFQLNARFAVSKPVPSLGDQDTPMQQVYRFYDYWIKFDSWRDFTNVNPEHNPDSATSREEKRWMMKENERVAKKLKKKEMARINEFVMRAMEHDPRVVADKERVKLEKMATKEAREREQQLKVEAKAAEEAKKAEEEAQRIREQKAEIENQKKVARLNRSVFRKLMKNFAELPNFSEPIATEDIDLLCQEIDSLELGQLNESLGGEGAVKDPSLLVLASFGNVQSKVADIKERLAQAAREEEIAKEERRKADLARSKAAELKKKGLQREWSREELSTLSKAIGKFPGGTKQRWKAVCNYMNEILKPEVPFEMEECMKATHNAMEHLAQMKESGGIGGKISAVPVATGPAASPSAVGNISTPAIPPPSPTTAPSPPAPSIQPAPSVAAPPSNTDDTADSDVWTQAQQQQLEQGLKKYPASMEKNERWTKIASEVTGKSKKACIARYKYLREEIQAKKASK